MKKVLFTLLVCAFGIMASTAQTTDIRELFKQMPDSIFPYLTLNNRLDCIDFKDSNMEARVANSFSGQTRMEVLNEHFISMWMNNAVTMQMRVLPTTSSVDDVKAVICMVTTYGTTVKESTVRFFSCKWRPLNTESYVSMNANELMQQPNNMPDERFQELSRLLEPYLIVAKLSEDVDELMLTLSNEALDEENRAETDEVIMQINLKWSGKKFN